MTGRWEPIVNQVWETNVQPCECCGQIVARRLWIAEVEGEIQAVDRCEVAIDFSDQARV